VLVDKYLGETEHRSGRVLARDSRPAVLAEAFQLPFRNNAFDFVIASHIAEHIQAPQQFCAELARVSASGYIETPGPLTDYLLGERFHIWSVRRSGDGLAFRPLLKPRSAFGKLISSGFYALFYMGEIRERPTWRPALMNKRVFGSPLWRAKGLLHRMWRSRLLRRWTYTCFYFHRRP